MGLEQKNGALNRLSCAFHWSRKANRPEWRGPLDALKWCCSGCFSTLFFFIDLFLAASCPFPLCAWVDGRWEEVPVRGMRKQSRARQENYEGASHCYCRAIYHSFQDAQHRQALWFQERVWGLTAERLQVEQLLHLPTPCHHSPAVTPQSQAQRRGKITSGR